MLDSTFLINHILDFWIISASFFIMIELILGFNFIVFFLASISSLVTALCLSFSDLPNEDLSKQFLIFLIVFISATLLYWIIIKFFKNDNEAYKNMIGQIAHITSNNFEKGEIGKIKWSGTICKAMIHPDSPEDYVVTGEKVVILDIKNNILIIKKNF